jgi:hypothetical protein
VPIVGTAASGGVLGMRLAVAGVVEASPLEAAAEASPAEAAVVEASLAEAAVEAFPRFGIAFGFGFCLSAAASSDSLRFIALTKPVTKSWDKMATDNLA